jgi:hemolysin III
MAAQLAAAIGIYALVAPRYFHAETRHPWMVVLWIALIGLPISLFEYLYHRYMLHSAVFPFMASMHRAHSTHHGLTYVKAPVTPHEPFKLVEVSSEFPIEEPHQEESMMFPLYALPIFIAVFMLLIAAPIKLVFPNQPIFLALTISVTLFYCAYEVWHVILHLPFDKFWKPMMDGRWTKRVSRRMYSFHLMHHWRPTANLALVGFWGIALWDYAFRTHRRPENLPLPGAEVNYNDARLAKPLWPIALLDRWQSGLYRGSRATERFLARIFLGRTAR